MLLGGPKYSTTRFTYNAETRTFSAEVSELLNEARENPERMIKVLHDPAVEKKLRTYTQKARKDYLTIIRKKTISTK